MNNPLKLYISYEKEDEKYYDKLYNHISQLRRENIIEIVSDINEAQIIMAIITPKFMKSDSKVFELELKIKYSSEAEKRLPVVIPCMMEHYDYLGNLIKQRIELRYRDSLKCITSDADYVELSKRLRALITNIHERSIYN